MNSLHTTRRRLRMSDEIQIPLINTMTTSICFVKFLATMLFLAGAGMMSNNDEWHVIGASALGGGFGAVVGVFLAVASTQVCLWQVLALRWAVNFCFALCFGPVIAIQTQEKIAPHLEFPGPILSIAAGGAAGVLGVILLQIFMPFIRKWLERKIDSTAKTLWSDSATPPKNPTSNPPTSPP